VSKPTDLVQGTLDLLILKIIALEPMHGWAIAQRIRQMSGEVLHVGQSALYPSLHKLEHNGWITAEWAISQNNRRAKYYTLTRSGKKALEQEAAQWERLAAAIAAHLDTLLANAGFARVIVRVVPDDVPEVARDLRRLRKGYEARFRALIDAIDVVPGVDRTLLRLMLLGALNATQTWFKRGAGKADTAVIASQFAAILRQGAARAGRQG